jgi:hypothetical protein
MAPVPRMPQRRVLADEAALGAKVGVAAVTDEKDVMACLRST